MSSTHIIPPRRTVRIEHTIHIIECANCSIDFGIGDDFMSRRRKDHGTFYCPNGHPNVYNGDNAEEAAKKEAERLRRLVNSEREYTESERKRRLKAERERAAARGQVTKIKNRVAKGVCPCCNRSFANLARHMDGQHPDWVGTKP